MNYKHKERYLHVSATEKGGRKGANSGRGTSDPSSTVPLTGRAIELLDQLLATMPKDQKPATEDGFSSPPYIVGIDTYYNNEASRIAKMLPATLS